MPSFILFGRLRVEYVHILQIISQVFPFVRTEYSQRKTDEGPKVDNRIMSAIMLAQFVNLGMAVMASGDAIVCTGRLDLLIFKLSIQQALILESGLQESTTATAAIIIGSIGLHIDEIFFAHHGFHHKPQVFCDGVAITLSNDLAGILHRELDFQILVPVRIDLQLAFTNPLGIILINILDFKIVFEVEFFQSGPDRESYVPSLRVEKYLTPQLIGLIHRGSGNLFP
jgi:hypothetical protein